MRGQRTSIGGSFARTNPMPTNSSTVDAANRLVAFNGAALTYDANGNLTVSVHPPHLCNGAFSL